MSNAAEARCRDGKDRRVKIVNDTSYTMRQLYGSNVGTNSWQEDVLGRDTLPPGRTVNVNFDDGTCYCTFDFKAVFSNGAKAFRRGYNVCRGNEWRISD